MRTVQYKINELSAVLKLFSLVSITAELGGFTALVPPKPNKSLQPRLWRGSRLTSFGDIFLGTIVRYVSEPSRITSR